MIMFSSHSSKPMVDQSRLPDAGPGNDCHDVDILVCPCAIQKSDILLSPKNIASGNGQSGYGNLLRRKCRWRFASYGARTSSGRFPQALTSDSAPCVDSLSYHRHCFQKFGRVLKTPSRIFFQQHLKQCHDRLWEPPELLRRQQRVLMLIHHLTSSPAKRRAASQHLPNCYTERVQIRADVHADAGKLFRTGELRRTSESSGS